VRSNDSPDVRVKAFDEHEESVYSVAWSACDPFVFISVSYDGRVVLNHVPSTEKYRLLL
jgi:WD40 repeat protein